MGLQLENTPNKTRKTHTIDMYIYIYSKNTSIYKYTTQWIHSIQKCLIQHAYTKVLIIQYVPKEKYTLKTLKKYTSGYPAQGKATRTTQPEEGKGGKGRVMSNAITQ